MKPVIRRAWAVALGALAVAACLLSQPSAQPATAAAPSAGPSAVPAAEAPATALFRLHGAQLNEISGIAAGIRSPGAVYVENDGGDTARFFALDAVTGALLAQYAVPGAANVDWEDIAVAPDARGTPSVWLADVGDNDAQRAQVEIYRVDEPRVPMRGSDQHRTSSQPDIWRLRYPSPGGHTPTGRGTSTGPHDAESLAVTPAGVPYLVTKSLTGVSEVLAATAQPGTQALRKVGEIHFHLTATPGPFAPFGELAATGADISRSGTRLVVRTYTDAYVWTVHDNDVGAALRGTTARIALPWQPQGEAICFAGRRLLIGSEGVGSTVYSLPLPTAAGDSAAPSAAVSPQKSTPTAATTTHGHRTGWLTGVLVLVGGLLAAIAVAVAVVMAVRHRRRHDQLG
jgi:hypothetical protein